jgi:hypothetical protein
MDEYLALPGEIMRVIVTTAAYGCGTWSVTLWEEHRLRVLRETFGDERDEVTREWRTLHKEELYDLYCWPNIIEVNKSRRMRWVRYVAGIVRG